MYNDRLFVIPFIHQLYNITGRGTIKVPQHFTYHGLCGVSEVSAVGKVAGKSVVHGSVPCTA